MPVVAPVDLLVLSTYATWQSGSDIRGGNYLWALDLPRNSLFYFARLDLVAVRSGEFLSAGAPLGAVGRSGKNATVPRSPTHLHMMVLKVEGTTLRPVDFWWMLGLGDRQ
ncbi:MAG: hypothetical protein JW913_09105 [Chitinispirillaceae bacterium]|nr:hypothetical protein [Chitinispirillaceae bacterium]